jgi:hypothetical protein
MTYALTLWLDRLFFTSLDIDPSTGRKPLEIEVERLPDYRWRDLGFQPRRRSDAE